MEIVIRKGEKQLFKNLIKKKSNYEERNEIVKLQNEIIIFEIVFGMVNG